MAGATGKGVFVEETKQSCPKKCIQWIHPPAAWKQSGIPLCWWLSRGRVCSHCLTAGFAGRCQVLDKYRKLCLPFLKMFKKPNCGLGFKAGNWTEGLSYRSSGIY